MQLISIEMFCSLWVARIPLTVHIAREKKSIWLFLLGVFFCDFEGEKKTYSTISVIVDIVFIFVIYL